MVSDIKPLTRSEFDEWRKNPFGAFGWPPNAIARIAAALEALEAGGFASEQRPESMGPFYLEELARAKAAQLLDDPNLDDGAKVQLITLILGGSQ